jgi:hypothetical protein
MNRIRIIRRLAYLLAGLAAALFAVVAAVPAAFASADRPPPISAPARPAPTPPGHVTGAILGPDRAGYPPVSHIRTVVTSGVPGWQIALIAAGAAVLAAALAVILDRAWAGRRHLAAPSA